MVCVNRFIFLEGAEALLAKGCPFLVDPGVGFDGGGGGRGKGQGEKVAAWLAADEVAKLSETRALDLFERDPELWAVVVSPWILIQERATN